MAALGFLLNLGFAGGSGPTPDSTFSYTVPQSEFVNFKAERIAERYMVYLDKGDNAEVTIDWTGWLDGSVISSVTWDAVGNQITVANETNTNTATTAYLSASGVARDQEDLVTVQVTSNDSPARIATRTIDVFVAHVAPQQR